MHDSCSSEIISHLYDNIFKAIPYDNNLNNRNVYVYINESVIAQSACVFKK